MNDVGYMNKTKALKFLKFTFMKKLQKDCQKVGGLTVKSTKRPTKGTPGVPPFW